MPEMNAPGVNSRESGSSPPPIRGIATSTAAFVGPTLQGPAAGQASEPITSFLQFETVYGTAQNLQFASPITGAGPVTVVNYMASAVQGFFANGGQQLYVSRVVTTQLPTAADYRAALRTLNGIKDISVVAAPGSSVFGGNPGEAPTPAQAAAIQNELIAHVEEMLYRFAVLDSPPGYSASDVQALRALVKSDNAALYYPWVTIANPLAEQSSASINVPPSGFVCGIYARSDAQQGVFKAPANLQVMGAVGFERAILDAESSALNALGINCLRYFPERGNLICGARTISSDPQWKYVNVRRYLIYLEQSIDQGTQWVVFEPNGPSLWGAVKNAIQNFLLNEWRHGGLLGLKATDAFFVKCDATTMTQDDIDNGRVICLIGVAVVKPAEFVIFRIGWQSGT